MQEKQERKKWCDCSIDSEARRADAINKAYWKNSNDIATGHSDETTWRCGQERDAEDVMTQKMGSEGIRKTDGEFESREEGQKEDL
ncbi:UNVERIFIED_CONTAM: hypothetical protein K2H54_069130 [Gekko kuhli]